MWESVRDENVHDKGPGVTGGERRGCYVWDGYLVSPRSRPENPERVGEYGCPE